MIFRQQPENPRPQARYKEGSDERISKMTGPIRGINENEPKTPQKPPTNLTTETNTADEEPYLPVTITVSTSHVHFTMTNAVPQGNEIRASEDPRAILSPTSVQIRHDQAKFHQPQIWHRSQI